MHDDRDAILGPGQSCETAILHMSLKSLRLSHERRSERIAAILENGIRQGWITQAEADAYDRLQQQAREAVETDEKAAYRLTMTGDQILQKADPDGLVLKQQRKRERQQMDTERRMFMEKVKAFEQAGVTHMLAVEKAIAEDNREELETVGRRFCLESETAWMESFLPTYVEGSDPGGCYSICPAKVKVSDKIDVYQDVERNESMMISVEEHYADPLLVGIFMEHLPGEWVLNRSRFSTVSHPDGQYVRGFCWYDHDNFYRAVDILSDLTRASVALRQDSLTGLSELQRMKLINHRLETAGTEQIPLKMKERIADFYEHFVKRLEQMLDQCPEDMVMTISFL